MPIRGVVGLLVTGALLSACAVVRPRFDLDELPRTFEGRYLWADASLCTNPFLVTLRIDRVERTLDGGIAFEGSNEYQPGDHRMRVHGRVNVRSLDVVLRETDPSRIDSVTHGMFEGRFAPDLRSLVAIWTTEPTGQVGALVLKATPPPRTEP